MNREKLLRGVASAADRETLARVMDLVEAVRRNHQPRLTDFYDPYHSGIITGLVARVPGLAVRVDGGYPAAERSRVLIYPDYLVPAPVDMGLALLGIEGDFRFQRVSHRDYLGSLLGLGLRRDKLGDLLVEENGAQIILAREVVSYIEAGLAQVGRVPVTVKELAWEELRAPQQVFREIRTTVQSPRLDAVAAHGFGLSRSKMAREIAAGNIALNWQPRLDPAVTVVAGDMISARGRGRVLVDQVGGQTKKGRIHLVLKRYR